jgi:hypothetical protein
MTQQHMIDRGRFLVVAWLLAGAYLAALYLSAFIADQFLVSVFFLAALLARTIVAQALPAVAATWFIPEEEFDANARWLIAATLLVTLLDAGLLLAPPALLVVGEGLELGPVLPFVFGPLVFFAARAAGTWSSSALVSLDSTTRPIRWIVPANVLLAATPALSALAGWVLLQARGRDAEWNPILVSGMSYVVMSTMIYPHLWVTAVLQTLLARRPGFAAHRRTIAWGVFFVSVFSAAPAVLMHAGFLHWGYSMFFPTYGMLLLCVVGIFLVLMVRGGETADSGS